MVTITTYPLKSPWKPRECTVDSSKNLPPGGLHCASMFGIAEIVAGLAEVEGYDISQEDYTSNTPLAWAACSGHEGVVKVPVLLGRGDANPD